MGFILFSSALVFVAVHVGALGFDRFIGFDWDDLLVPYASDWRPDAVAWGITAAYLLIAVEATSLLARHLRRGLWHAIHLLGYVVFVAVTVHALLAGTDADVPALQVFAITSAALVALLTVVRLATVLVPRDRGATPAGLPRSGGPRSRPGTAAAPGPS